MPSGMFDFADIFSAAGVVTLGQVILIDLTMAGDNVVIIGALTSGLPGRDRRKVIMLGVGLALIFLVSAKLANVGVPLVLKQLIDRLTITAPR